MGTVSNIVEAAAREHPVDRDRWIEHQRVCQRDWQHPQRCTTLTVPKTVRLLMDCTEQPTSLVEATQVHTWRLREH